MTKNVEVTIDINIARKMLRIAGFAFVNDMTDDEVFEQALKMNEEYAVKSTIITLPDMREKVKEYISELDTEIGRCTKFVEDKMKELKNSNFIGPYTKSIEYVRMESRLQTLTEVKNDLQGRLEELV